MEVKKSVLVGIYLYTFIGAVRGSAGPHIRNRSEIIGDSYEPGSVVRLGSVVRRERIKWQLARKSQNPTDLVILKNAKFGTQLDKFGRDVMPESWLLTAVQVLMDSPDARARNAPKRENAYPRSTLITSPPLVSLTQDSSRGFLYRLKGFKGSVRGAIKIRQIQKIVPERDAVNRK